MQTVLYKIKHLKGAYTGKKIDTEAVILYQRKLKLNNMPPLPQDWITFLHAYNSLSHDGVNLFGLHPRDETDMDILYENILIEQIPHETLLILGMDELDYLAWNEESKAYQRIDKGSLEVLNTYKNCKIALSDFLSLE